jgi:hypothetical protein
MCRAVVNDDPTTARRCASCLDKDKRSAANSAYYSANKYSTGTSFRNTVLSAIGLRKDELIDTQSERLTILENMPQVDQLRSFTDRMKAESNKNTIAITYDNKGLYESTSLGNDSTELKELAVEISEKVAQGFEAEMFSPHKDVIKCTVGTVTFNALGSLRVGGSIFHNGIYVGSWLRSVKFGTGVTENHMVYELMDINEEQQGKKIGTSFIGHFDSIALAMGINRIKLEANLDIGGYAWAKHGYDWDTEYGEPDTKTMQTKLLRYASENNDTTATEARALANRLAQPFDHNYPTPLEIAMTGYQSRDTDNSNREMWLGKTIMLESAWWGTRKLTGETHV